METNHKLEKKKGSSVRERKKKGKKRRKIKERERLKEQVLGF